MVVTFYAQDSDDRIGKMRELADKSWKSFSVLMREAIDKYLKEAN